MYLLTYLLPLNCDGPRNKVAHPYDTNQISLHSTFPDKKETKKGSTIAVISLFPRPLKIQKPSSLIRIPQRYSTLIKVCVE